ncbi:hypothetical protein HZU77_013505 [Neisseriaceae bacterium TC5R-5]|nr:hypothetical protein [Neisseriaceae bacterium TC5R-5]
MSKPSPELDAATKQRLAEEVERLVQMEVDRAQARRIVWEDYLEEQAAYAKARSAPVAPRVITEAVPSATMPAPSGVGAPYRRFWQAKEEKPFTQEWLQSNRVKLAKIKKWMAELRNKA